MRQIVRGILVVVGLSIAAIVYARTPKTPKTTPSLPSPQEVVQTQNSVQEPPSAPMVDFSKPQPYVVNKITVTGVRFLDPEVLANSIGINKGDTVMLPSDYISSALRRIWGQRYFSDIRIIADPVGDSVNFQIYMQERPRVFRWLFTGVTKGAKTDLEGKLNLKKGGELSDYVLNTSVNIIKKYYREKGFLNAEVDVLQTNDTVHNNIVDVTFAVVRGPRVRIGRIEFEGNEIFSDKKLRKTFKKTHQKSIKFFQSSKLKEKEFETDKENLIDFYNSKGYRNAMILSDSIYPISPNRIAIRLTVEEGRKYYLRNVTWIGNSVFKTEELSTMLSMTKGAVYDLKAINKRLGIDRESSPEEMSVSSLYQNKGYIMSNIELGEVVLPGDSVDLHISIYEGKQARINEVTITGNRRVNEDVIRRELYTRPGELYDRSMLMQTLRQLSQMGHFNPENLQPNITPITNELINISFPLEEIASDKFEVSGGWGSGMFVGSVGVQLTNFAIKDFFHKNAWQPYPSGQNQQLAIRGQTNGTFYKALSLNFTEPWLGGKKPHALTVGLYYSDESNSYSILQSSTKHFRTLGTSVGVGRRLAWPDRYFNLYNEVGYQAYMLKDWDNFVVTNGVSNIITFRTVFGRNSVDQPIYPRQGSDFSVSLTLTPPYSLFNGVDYSNPNLSEIERYRFIEYHKWLFKGEWYYPLSANRKLVLNVGAQMGYLGSYNPHKPSPFEGFDVGGDGMSGYNLYGVDIVRLRGYTNGSLTPYPTAGQNYANVYNRYTVEMRYPFIMTPASTIYGLVFAEGGNAFSSWQDYDPFVIKRSLGAGIRIQMPILGLIGFDWGYGFDTPARGSGRSGGQLHFMLGQQF